MQHPRRHRGHRAALSATVAAAALTDASLTALNGAGTAQAATARQVERPDGGVVGVRGIKLDGTRPWPVTPCAGGGRPATVR